MGRRKVTYEIDGDLVHAVKRAALAESKAEYLVVEDALREHLLGPTLTQARDAMGDLTEQEAIEIATQELAAVRARREPRRRR